MSCSLNTGAFVAPILLYVTMQDFMRCLRLPGLDSEQNSTATWPTRASPLILLRTKEAVEHSFFRDPRQWSITACKRIGGYPTNAVLQQCRLASGLCNFTDIMYLHQQVLDRGAV